MLDHGTASEVVDEEEEQIHDLTHEGGAVRCAQGACGEVLEGLHFDVQAHPQRREQTRRLAPRHHTHTKRHQHAFRSFQRARREDNEAHLLLPGVKDLHAHVLVLHLQHGDETNDLDAQASNLNRQNRSSTTYDGEDGDDYLHGIVHLGTEILDGPI